MGWKLLQCSRFGSLLKGEKFWRNEDRAAEGEANAASTGTRNPSSGAFPGMDCALRVHGVGKELESMLRQKSLACKRRLPSETL